MCATSGHAPYGDGDDHYRSERGGLFQGTDILQPLIRRAGTPDDVVTSVPQELAHPATDVAGADDGDLQGLRPWRTLAGRLDLSSINSVLSPLTLSSIMSGCPPGTP